MDVEGTPHSAILIRGADGRLWYMLDTDDHPIEIEKHLADKVMARLGKPMPAAATDVGEKIAQELSEIFGIIPNIGHWWVWGPGPAK